MLPYRTEGKPAKPPNSGYSLFSQKLLASDSLKNFESKDRMAEISRQWKELDEDNKNNYKQEALQVTNCHWNGFFFLCLPIRSLTWLLLSSTHHPADARLQDEIRLLPRVASARTARGRTDTNQFQKFQTRK